MTDTAIKIITSQINKGSLGVFFMGQAGVILKSPSGQLLAVDLYLSDCCNRYFGFKRLMPRLIGIGDIKPDCVFATHAHYDHFDPDTIPTLLEDGGRLYAARDCRAECDRLGIKDMTPLIPDEPVQDEDFTVMPIECDHGEGTPYAVGLYITCGEKHVYIAGDTCFRADIASKMSKYPIDIMFAPINGAFGNLNERQAAEFFSIVKPNLCVPCHYWNFAEHGGNPGLFAEIINKEYPQLSYKLMYPGELEII